MAVASRETCRDGLAALLTSGVTAAQAVYAYQVGDFAQLMPVVRVLSSGGARPPMTQQGVRSVFYFEVQWFVLNVDPEAGWTEANAEDKLDEVENQIMATIDSNDGKTAYWDALELADRSQVTKGVVGGRTYLIESVIVAAHVFG